MVGLLRAAEGQYTNGGSVSVTCNDCDCYGISEDGADVLVFDNPNTGKRVVSLEVEGSEIAEYSEIAETSCGTSVFSVGSTVYELDGVSLRSRELDVIEMEEGGICLANAASGAVCYSGTKEMDMPGRVTATFTECACIATGDAGTTVQTQVDVSTEGASFVDVEDVTVCLDVGFISHLVTVQIDEGTYYFNFDLAIPGRDSSADLPSASAPASTAQAFSCGELEPTPAPVSPVPPTPAPVTPVPPPTAAPVTPVPPPTAAPVTPIPPTPSPVTPDPPTPDPTPGPVTPATPQPVAAPETPAPVAPEREATAQPATAEPVHTTIAPGTVNPSGVPSSSTLAPAGAVLTPPGETQAPTAGSTAGVGLTIAPVGDRSVGITPSPVFIEEVEGQECGFPLGTESCTDKTVASKIRSGVGSFYDPTCKAAWEAGGELPNGCDTRSPEESCRDCLFDTPMWKTENPDEDLPDYVDCPCCVLDVYDEPAFNEEGERCINITPAPATTTAAPSAKDQASTDDGAVPAADTMFEDKPLRISSGGGVDAGILALGLLAVLTFFPVCVK